MSRCAVPLIGGERGGGNQKEMGPFEAARTTHKKSVFSWPFGARACRACHSTLRVCAIGLTWSCSLRAIPPIIANFGTSTFAWVSPVVRGVVGRTRPFTVRLRVLLRSFLWTYEKSFS